MIIRLNVILLIIVVFGCEPNKKEEFIPSRKDVKPSIKLPKKDSCKDLRGVIDLDVELTQEFGDHFVEYEKGVLSLCCLEELAYPFGGNELLEVKNNFIECQDSLYTSEEGVDCTRLFTEYSNLTLFKYENGEITEFLIKDSSYFSDPNITLNNGVKIGMDKSDLFNMFFYSKDESVLSDLNIISVSSDEKGELYTQYHFISDTLAQIFYSENIE